MRRFPCYLALAFLILWGALAYGDPARLDPLLRSLLSAWEKVGAEGLVALGYGELAPLELAGEGAAAAPRVRVLVAARDPEALRAIPYLEVHTVSGAVATAAVPVGRLPELADAPGIVFVQASRPLRPAIDISVPEIGAPELWHGTPATTGEGAIVGVVDTGLDVLHPAFRVDRDGDGIAEGTRVLWLWDQTLGGTPDAWPFSYGEDFSREEIEGWIASGNPLSRDVSGHGTHVTGIAASSERDLPGVAPGAELVIVKSTFYEDTVVDGVRFVFDVADSLGLPAVVNLSLGGHGGPHDGTSLFEQAIDDTLDRPGRAIAVAAGNEAEDRIHVGAEVLGPVTWHVVVDSPQGEAQFWHPAAAAFAVRVEYATGTMEVPPGSQDTLPVAGGYIQLDNASQGPDPRNGADEVYLMWSGIPSGTAIALTFTPQPTGGRIDGWVTSTDYGYFQEGNAEMTIAEPGNAHRVITVGAYVTRNRWMSQAGQQVSTYTLGALAPFSSHGPTRDGRLKPDVAAPGAWILSARSRYAGVAPQLLAPDGIHRYMAGTSMAAPHVAGTCALLLSLAPDATWEEIRAAIAGGAREDAYTGWLLPDDEWGYGKVYVPGAAAELPSPVPEGIPYLEALTAPAVSEALFRYAVPPGTTRIGLRIYDIRGALVYAVELPVAGRIARWDLATTAGSPVANGLYIAVLVTDRGSSAPVKVVVER